MEDASKTPLEKWMRETGRDDAAVAEATGVVSRSQVNRLKRAMSKPSFKSATALEKLTGIPAGELFRELGVAA